MLASREGLGVATTEFEMKERRRIQAWIHDQSMSERKVVIVGEDWIRQGTGWKDWDVNEAIRKLKLEMKKNILITEASEK